MPLQEKKPKKKVSFLSRFLLITNALVLSGLAMGFVAAYIPPDKWWLFAFAGLAFPYLAVLNIVFLVIWLLAGKKYIFISLAALLICWNRLSGFIQINLSKSVVKTENSINVVSYNVRIFDRYNWKDNKVSKTAVDILKLTKELSPDILCIQEYHAGRKGKDNLEDSIRKYTGLKYNHIEFARLGGKTRPYGIATFSRWPVISSNTINFEGNTVNFCLCNDIVYKGDTLRIFNIHLESIQFSREDYLYVSDLAKQPENQELFSENSLKIFRKLQKAFIARASQARVVAERIQASPYPVIVCGDFNDTPSSYSYHQISSGLSDTYKVSGSGFGQTYAGILPSFRIDYILNSPELKSSEFKRIREPLSDHYPVSAVINLPGKEIPE